MSSITDILNSIPTDPLTGAIAVPIYQTSTFVQQGPGINKGFDYARTGNPTRKVLEDVIAALEKGDAGFAFSSGLAAIDAVLKLLRAGDEIVAVDDIYGGAYRLFTHIYEKLGIKIKYVDTTDVDNVKSAVTSKTKLIWLESPTNPTLKVSDIKAISKFAREVDAYLVVDNTFASPILQKPIELGADIVIHSATKYIAGHSDVLAGLVVTANSILSEKIKFIQNASGAALGPWDCFLTLRGIHTLPLRFEKQSENARQISKYLSRHELVDRVFYPGLYGHKNHEVGVAQQKKGFGGVISFSLKIDTPEAALSVVRSTRHFQLAESLGGTKSLICIPAQMTHASVPREKRLSTGIKDSLIRISCGIEEVNDLITDLERALSTVASSAVTIKKELITQI